MLEKKHSHKVASSGPKCTWTNKNWDWRHHIREKLDRAFSNADWQVAFPKGHCLTLARLHSDHHPIMVYMDGWEPHRRLKQFLYQPMWQTHPLFHQAIVNCWSNHETHVQYSAHFTADFYKKILHLQACLTDWDTQIFCQMGQNKRRIRARLLGA